MQAQSEAAQADFANARQPIAAMVARSRHLAIEARLRRALAVEALRPAQELHRTAREHLRVGVGDEQAVAERRVAAAFNRVGEAKVARTAHLRVQTERLAQRANLYLALGGGGDLQSAAAAPAEKTAQR